MKTMYCTPFQRGKLLELVSSEPIEFAKHLGLLGGSEMVLVVWGDSP